MAKNVLITKVTLNLLGSFGINAVKTGEIGIYKGVITKILVRIN